MSNPLQKKAWFTSGGGGGATLPADAAGYLYNNGTGTLSWAAAGTGDLLANGTVPLTADWAAGAYKITMASLQLGTSNYAYFTSDGGIGASWRFNSTSNNNGVSMANGALIPIANLSMSLGKIGDDNWLWSNVYSNNLLAVPTLGAELITNFAGWTDVADWSYGSSKWTHAATGATALVSDWSPTVGLQYKIVVTITHTSGTGVVVSCGGQTYASGTATATFYLSALSTAALTFTPSANWVGDITAVSVMAETNGALTATTGTFMNGLEVKSGQLLLPSGGYAKPSISFIEDPSIGFRYDPNWPVMMVMGGNNKCYFGLSQIWFSQTSFTIGGVGNSTFRAGSEAGSLGVVEKQITPGSGTGLTVNDAGSLNRQVYKVTVDYTGFAGATGTTYHTIATLPAKTKIMEMYVDTTVPFTGGGVTATTMQVGNTNGGTEYMKLHDVFSAPIIMGLEKIDMGTELNGDNSYGRQFGAVMNWTGTTNIIVSLNTTTAATNALTAGSTTYYIVTERF